MTGDYEVDEFGFDADVTKVLLSLLRPLYEGYFRVEVKGIENIPAEGGALVVSNHSGTLPIDALMTQVAVHDHHPAGRTAGRSPRTWCSCCRSSTTWPGRPATPWRARRTRNCCWSAARWSG